MKEYVFKINPMGKPRMTQSDRWRKRPCVLRYFAFKDELNKQALELGYVPQECLDLIFVLPMAPSWPKKKKLVNDGMPHRQRPDIDNMCKAFMDALLKEDSSVHTLCASKVWGREGKIIVREYNENNS